MGQEFQNGLCSCFGNCQICIITYFLPCYTEGKIAEALGEDCLLWGLLYLLGGCLVGGYTRSKVRSQKGIDGNLCGDFCLHMWCACCALIQEQREFEEGGAGQSIARV